MTLLTISAANIHPVPVLPARYGSTTMWAASGTSSVCFLCFSRSCGRRSASTGSFGCAPGPMSSPPPKQPDDEYALWCPYCPMFVCVVIRHPRCPWPSLHAMAVAPKSYALAWSVVSRSLWKVKVSLKRLGVCIRVSESGDQTACRRALACACTCRIPRPDRGAWS